MKSDFDPRPIDQQVNELLRAGKAAFDQGDRRRAHDLWREAATLDPYNEQVWLALFRVLDTDEDRIVCLQNIIAINPLNVKARQRLRAYETAKDRVMADRALDLMNRDTRQLAHVRQQKRQRRQRIRRLIMLAILGLVVAVLLGIIASVILYAL